jgi:hypothetical protein
MRHHLLPAIAAALGLFVLLGTAPAQARQNQTQTEATFLSHDTDAHTITVEVLTPRRSGGANPPKNLRLKRGEHATFNVKESGSVLTSTIVKSREGTRMTFEKLTPGVKVFVFWVPDEKDDSARFARSISVYVAAQDWGNAEDVEVPAAAAD